MSHFLLFGYFGAGNFGDEWTLASFINGCNSFGLSPEKFVVLSRAPRRTEAEHNVAAVPRNWQAVFSSLSKCQWLIGCGGSLLQDVTSLRSLIFYCLLIWCAKAFGKEVALLGQGIGPLKRPLSRKLVKWTLNVCDLVTFREPLSFEFARRLGVKTERCFVTSDLTFIWDKFPKRERKASIGVNLRPLKERWSGKALETALRGSVGKGERILLLPLQPNADELTLKPFSNLPNADWWRYETWFDGLEGIANVAILIAMRLHALIAACLLGVPFLALNYDPKVANILHGVATERILPLSADSAEIARGIERVRQNESALVSRLIEFASTQRVRAWKNFELLAGKLSG